MMNIPQATPEQQAEIDAHWDAVRQGLHKSAPHLFRDESNADAIRRLQDTAQRLIEQAARAMREAKRLSEVDA